MFSESIEVNCVGSLVVENILGRHLNIIEMFHQ